MQDNTPGKMYNDQIRKCRCLCKHLITYKRMGDTWAILAEVLDSKL